MLNLKKIRSDFPIISKKRNNKPVVYFDNAATTHKPRVVIDSISEFYSNYNGNVQRGVHFLGERATSKFENTREVIRCFLGAKSIEEIIFNSGVTHGINMVAFGFLPKIIKKGDHILIGEMEHHANIVPWQIVAKKLGAKIIPVNHCQNGELDILDLNRKLTDRVRFVTVQHVSNITGCKNNIKKISSIVHKKNAYLLVDGAQAVSHCPVNMQDLDCDFYCFSGHKCFGPTGTGVLFGKKSLLLKMNPFMGGGNMISKVSILKSSWGELPHKLEAGTPNIAGIIGLGVAIKYILNIGFSNIRIQEELLTKKMWDSLSSIKNLNLFTKANPFSPIFSFNMTSAHNYDVGALLDEMNICVRTGNLCAEPASKLLNPKGFIRASLCFYNTEKEIVLFTSALKKTINML